MSDQASILWQPDRGFIESSNLYAYEEWLHQTRALKFKDYDDLWKWSTTHIEDFWESLWHYFDIDSPSPYAQVLNTHAMPGAQWFEGALLNYAQQVFRHRSDDRPALVFKSEIHPAKEISWQQLEEQVSRMRAYLIDMGLTKGDCVAAYLPNIPEAISSFLAVNSIGAVWSCCSPDFGVDTVLDRFKQIDAKILITADGYYYNGKAINRTGEVQEIARALPTVKDLVVIPYLQKAGFITQDHTTWEQIQKLPLQPLSFELVEFSHPIWVLYSSGTTGKPKAITHSQGGVLLEHLKYMHFHNDVKAGENFFWFTTTGWMMWNFLQASLLAGATAILYDGSPASPSIDTLWQLADELPIHHFGTSAPYLIACMNEDLHPGKEFDLSSLRSIGSTGAPLPPEAFDWVYQKVSSKVWLCSMSGGTDVCTAFVGGIPFKPVIRGRIQGRALGCKLTSKKENGEDVLGTLGEMVISEPMPSMPVYFWNDEGNQRYQSSYFDKYPGYWCHGDWIQLYEDGSLIIQGRSDATLNRKGIRIGTAEIYSLLNQLDGITDSLIVNLELPGGLDYMPLFITLEEGYELDALKEPIRYTLKTKASPRHLPDQIIAVPDIPYTLSGKKMEVPVKKILLDITDGSSLNKDSCKNPQALVYFQNFAKTLIK